MNFYYKLLIWKFFLLNIFYARVFAFSVINFREGFSWMLFFWSFTSLICFFVILLMCQQCFKKMNFEVMENEQEDNNNSTVVEKLQNSIDVSIQNNNLLMIRPTISHLKQQTLQPITSSIIEQLEKSFTEALVLNSISYCCNLENSFYGQVKKVTVDTETYIVHTLHKNASVMEHFLFLSELAGYKSLKHSNIIQFYGLIRDDEGLSAVFEYCTNGNLKSFMRTHRSSYKDINSKNLLPIFATHIATGLHALHQSGFVHRDLALRNCLLTNNLTIKIGEFSQAHLIYPEDYMLDREGNAIAIRWLAPEVVSWNNEDLVMRQITMDSNLWSFGVLMWELVTFGAMPYNDMSNLDVIQHVICQQHIMPQPHVPISNLQQMYKLMQGCWQVAENRVSMKKMRLLLLQFLTNDNEDQTDFSSFQLPISQNNQSDHSSSLNLTSPFHSFMTNKPSYESCNDLHKVSANYDNTDILSSNYNAKELHLSSANFNSDLPKSHFSLSYNTRDFQSPPANYDLESFHSLSVDNLSTNLYKKSKIYTIANNENIQLFLNDNSKEMNKENIDCKHDSNFRSLSHNSNIYPLDILQLHLLND